MVGSLFDDMLEILGMSGSIGFSVSWLDMLA